MSNNKGLFVPRMIEHRDSRRFHTEFVTEVATSSTSFNRPIQPPFINKRYTFVRMYRGFGRAKFPNENVHRICTRPSLRVLTCPLRHRVCNRVPISWEGRRSTRFRHSRKIGWNAIRNIGSEICTLRGDIKACPKVSKARSGKRQRLDVVHAEWGGKKGNVG